jgi:hypothetical protein
MRKNSQQRRLTKLGIAKFETVREVRHFQNDLIPMLKRGGLEARRWRALGKCDPIRCGRTKCSDACWFGTRRRRLKVAHGASLFCWFSTGAIRQRHGGGPGPGGTHGRALQGAPRLAARQQRNICVVCGFTLRGIAA